MAYSFDDKPGAGTTVEAGTPIGLLLSLTYSAAFSTENYVFDSEPSAVGYSFDTKPS